MKLSLIPAFLSLVCNAFDQREQMLDGESLGQGFLRGSFAAQHLEEDEHATSEDEKELLTRSNPEPASGDAKAIDTATRSELFELRNEVAEARDGFRNQAEALKSVVEEANDLKLEYRDRLLSTDSVEEPAADDFERRATKASLRRHPEVMTRLVDQELDGKSQKRQDPKETDDKKDEDEDDGLFRPISDAWDNGGRDSHLLRAAVQIVIGFFYYFLIVRYYPKLNPGMVPPPEAMAIQQMNPVLGALEAPPQIFACSFCCSGARAAHTFDSAGVMNFWFGLVCMSLFPCCTLFLTNSFTDLNVRLGGEQMRPLNSCVTSCCCSCCLIAQDAQSLDLVTGVKTNLFGYEVKARAAMYAMNM